MKIIAQLYTVRELLKDKSYEEIKSVLSTISQQGYQGVQISGVGEVTKAVAETFRDICGELGLDIGATHTSLEALQKDLPWIIEYHKMWDCKYVGIGSMPDCYRTMETVTQFAEICNVIGSRLKEEGLTLVYHNHRFEYEGRDGRTMMDILFDTLDPSCVQFELDTYWVQAGGCSPEAWIRKVAGRMDVVHLKDMKIVKDEQQFAELGQGNLNWKTIIEACEETDILYAAVEQDDHTDNPLESLGISIDYLKEQGLMPAYEPSVG